MKKAEVIQLFLQQQKLAANGKTILVSGLNPNVIKRGAISIAGMPNPAMPSIKLPINTHKMIITNSFDGKEEVIFIKSEK